MSICYNTINIFSPRTPDKSKFIDVKIITFYINYKKLTDIIKKILTDFCDATVIGYEKITNKYWCKVYDKNYCSIHIELEIFKKCDKFSLVKFTPLIGSGSLIENFVSNFTESIQLYTTSSFIRACLEANSAL
jgi:hypothetical protein